MENWVGEQIDGTIESGIRVQTRNFEGLEAAIYEVATAINRLCFLKALEVESHYNTDDVEGAVGNIADIAGGWAGDAKHIAIEASQAVDEISARLLKLRASDK